MVAKAKLNKTLQGFNRQQLSQSVDVTAEQQQSHHASDFFKTTESSQESIEAFDEVPMLPEIKEYTPANPTSKFINSNPKFIKMMADKRQPIPVSGQAASIPKDRKVVWKNVCKIGEESRECIVEMSLTKTKFYIVAVDL